MKRISYMTPECVSIELEQSALLCVSVETDFYDPEIGYGDPSIE